MGIFQLIYLVTGVIGLLLTIQAAMDLANYLSFQWVGGIDPSLYLTAGQFPCDKPIVDPLLWNMALLSLFIIQHSVMASKWWKNMLMKFGHSAVERSLYVIATCLVLKLVMKNYMPLPAFTLWNFELQNFLLLGTVLHVLHFVLWTFVFLSTLGMEFFEFVGLKQVYNYCWKPNAELQTENIEMQKVCNHMKHSGVACFVVILWIHPIMNVEKLLISFVFTLYSLLGHHITIDD